MFNSHSKMTFKDDFQGLSFMVNQKLSQIFTSFQGYTIIKYLRVQITESGVR